MASIKEFNWDYSNPLQAVDFIEPGGREARESRRASATLRMYAGMGSLRPSRIKFYHDHMDKLQADARADGKTFRRPFSLPTLKSWSMNYRWTERLKRFDEIELDAQLERMRARADASHETSIKALEDWRGKMIEGIAVIDSTTATHSEITAGLRMTAQELSRIFALGMEAAEKQKAKVTTQKRQDDSLAGLSDEEIEEVLANIESAASDTEITKEQQ